MSPATTPDRGRPFHHRPPQARPPIGRARGLARAWQRLLDPQTRLLTFTGPPGAGTTRLALAVAGALVADFSDGVQFVELTPVGDPDLVAAAVARTLGPHGVGAQSAVETVARHLAGRQLLLVVDTFAPVRPAAPQIGDDPAARSPVEESLAAASGGPATPAAAGLPSAPGDEMPAARPASHPRSGGAGAVMPAVDEPGIEALTRREREVAALIASGATNRQIAAELVISPHTAERHVERILAKLDCASRAEVAAWAVRQGLPTRIRRRDAA